MAYGLYLTLDQKRWFHGDFSDEDYLTGTIYTDSNRTTAKTLTGYTITIRMHRPNSTSDLFNQTATIVTAGSGTWRVAVTDGTMPTSGVYYVKAELTKSGTKESTLNRVELDVVRGPTS